MSKSPVTDIISGQQPSTVTWDILSEEDKFTMTFISQAHSDDTPDKEQVTMADNDLKVGSIQLQGPDNETQPRTDYDALIVKPRAKNLNDYADECHEANSRWWCDLTTGKRLDRNKGEMFMLMVSEISEAMEGARKNLQDDKLPHRKMEEVELADCLIRIFDYAGAHGFDLESAYREKMEYNRTREDHKAEQRLRDNGKKW